MIKNSVRIGLPLLVFCLLVTACAREPATEEGLQTVRIGYQPTVFYSYLFLAEDLGLFEKAGLKADLVRIPSANEMFQAFLAGQLDMTGLTATEILLRGYERTPGGFYLPLMVELGPDAVADRILVLEDSPITSIHDLAGLRVGSHPGTTVPNVLRAVLAKHDVDASSVEIQELRPELQVEATLSGAVSAIICLEPCGTELLVTGKVRTLYDHPFGAITERFPASFTTVGKELVETRPDVAQRLVEVIRLAVAEYRDLVATDRDAINRLTEKYLGTRSDVAARLEPVAYRLPEEWSPQDIAAVVQFYQSVGVIAAPVELEEFALPRPEEVSTKLREAA